MYTVLHTESSAGWGGQESRTLHESLGLRKQGVRAVILCQPGSILGKRADSEGLEVRTCRMRKNYDLAAIGFILRLIQAEGIDVISTHSGRDRMPTRRYTRMYAGSSCGVCNTYSAMYGISGAGTAPATLVQK